MDAYEWLQKRLRSSNSAKPRATFEKTLSILKGEVFFIDKDLLMGADHEGIPPCRQPVQCIEKQLKDELILAELGVL